MCDKCESPTQEQIDQIADYAQQHDCLIVFNLLEQGETGNTSGKDHGLWGSKKGMEQYVKSHPEIFNPEKGGREPHIRIALGPTAVEIIEKGENLLRLETIRKMAEYQDFKMENSGKGTMDQAVPGSGLAN